MRNLSIILSVLLVSFLQVIHIFEEIALNAYLLESGKNPRGKYLKIASVMVFLNFAILFLLILDLKAAYYLVFYSVLISVGNLAAHIVLLRKHTGKLGYAFPSSIPLALAGFTLLFFLIRYFITQGS